MTIDPYFTFNDLQRWADYFHQKEGAHVVQLVMSHATRRYYLRLLENCFSEVTVQAIREYKHGTVTFCLSDDRLLTVYPTQPCDEK